MEAEYIECRVSDIVEKLIKNSMDDEVVALLYMSRKDSALFSEISLALGNGAYYASSKKTMAVIDTLVGMGLARKITVHYYRKEIRVYILTECGLRVARSLSRIFGLEGGQKIERGVFTLAARDNLDSKLTVEENLAIVDNILGQYLNEDK